MRFIKGATVNQCDSGFCAKCGRFMFGTGRCNWCGITYGASSATYREIKERSQ